MYTLPNPYYRHSSWMRTGAEFAGIMIAGRCILAMAFFGFGVLLMGIVMTVVAQCFQPPHIKENANKDPDKGNPVKILGPTFLSVGSVIFIVSVVMLVVAIKSARRTLVKISDSEDNSPNSIAALGPTFAPAHYFPSPEEPFSGYHQTVPYSSKQPFSATYSGNRTVMAGEPLAPAYPPHITSAPLSLSSFFK